MEGVRTRDELSAMVLSLEHQVEGYYRTLHHVFY